MVERKEKVSMKWKEGKEFGSLTGDSQWNVRRMMGGMRREGTAE